MARTTFVLAVWLLAGSVGVLGYQALTLYFYDNWPAVSLAAAWDALGGSLLWEPGGRWPMEMPLVLLGVVFSYVMFFVSDLLRGRSGRQG